MSDDAPDFFEWIGYRLAGRWKLLRKIGSGHFGCILLAEDNRTNKNVAVKLSCGSHRQELHHEYNVLEHIHRHEVQSGIPYPLGIGDYKSPSKVTTVTLSLLGSDLSKIRKTYRLSLQTIYRLGIQLIKRLQSIHEQDFIHCDIKPNNLMVGHEDPWRLYLIDFGVAERFRNERTGRHKPKRKHHVVHGPVTYWTLWTHEGWEKSRRDDMLMAGYALVEMYRGSLPWSRIYHFDDRVERNMMYDRKKNTSVSVLCDGMSSGIKQYFEYVLSLHFDSKPDYSYLKTILRRTMEDKKWEEDGVDFEWEKPEEDGMRGRRVPTASGRLVGGFANMRINDRHEPNRHRRRSTKSRRHKH